MTDERVPAIPEAPAAPEPAIPEAPAAPEPTVSDSVSPTVVIRKTARPRHGGVGAGQGQEGAGATASGVVRMGTQTALASDSPGDATQVFDVIIIGAGPAGLSAGLNLVRARRQVLMVDSNRPRHSATLKSHGFITRDGVSPLELRTLGREEFVAYPEGHFHQGLVQSIERITEPSGELFVVRSTGIRGSGDRIATARTLLIATGLLETLPALPSIRAYYGTSMHSCTECDGYENSDEPLALIGETDDLAERALLISQWSNDLIVFTNGVAALSDADEAALDARGIGVERRPIADIEGDRGGMTGVSLADGTVIPRSGGFVRPEWTTALDYTGMLQLETDDQNLLVVDQYGRTTVEGVFAAGDSTPPGAQQLIVAAGAGAKVASAINRHLIGIL